MIAVNEVDVRTCTNTAEKANARLPLMALCKIQGVPSHVRNLQPGRLDAAHPAGKDAESCSVWRFVAAFEKDLQADADAKKRLSRFYLMPYHRDQPRRFQTLHAVAECAHARQDELLRRRNSFCIVRDLHFCTTMEERFFHAEEVSYAVINDRNHANPPIKHPCSTARL